jgi:hypothetical protein
VIAPIGKLGSPIRKRIDQICNSIIIPAVTEQGYEFIRSDMIKASGVIYHQIINHLRDDDLVIADLTKLNANVIFELGIRHAVNKPVIHIKETKQRLPFDVSAIRCIDFDFGIDNSMQSCKAEIIAFIKNMELHPKEVQLPFDAVLAMDAIDKNDAQKKVNLEILTELQNLRIEVSGLKFISKAKTVDSTAHDNYLYDKMVEAQNDVAYEQYFEEHGHYPDEPPPDGEPEEEGPPDENPDEEEDGRPDEDPRDER